MATLSTRILVASVIAMTGVSCKPAAKSTTASLDNIQNQAEGKLEADNYCGVKYTQLKMLPDHVQLLYKHKRVKGPKAMRHEVLGTLAAAPIDLLRPFATVGGYIKVMKTTDEAVKACAKAPVSDAEMALLGPDAKVTSCWQAEPTRIILPPDSIAIRKQLIRQLALFFSEYFVDRALEGEAPFDQQEWSTWLKGFASARSSLSTAFFTDLQRIDPKTHDKIFGALSEKHRDHFVYAEALDSYYCSTDAGANSPRTLFRNNYTAAWAVFTDKNNEHSPIRVFGE